MVSLTVTKLTSNVGAEILHRTTRVATKAAV